MMQSNIWQTTPFHLWPCSNLKSVSRLRTHRCTPLLFLVFHPLFPASFPSSPTLSSLVLHSTLRIYFHLPYTLHSPRSPPNRQGCCGWHVSSWEQPCRVDGPQYTERRDSPTTQPSVRLLFFFPSLCGCVCACLSVYSAPHRTHSCTTDVNLTCIGKHCMCMWGEFFFSRGGYQKLCYHRTTNPVLDLYTIRGLSVNSSAYFVSFSLSNAK